MNAMNRFATDQGYNTGGGPNAISGMVYNPQAYQKPKPRMSNPLNEQQYKLLMNTFQEEFNLKVTDEELAKAICTHKYSENMPGVDPNMIGKYAVVPVPGEPGMLMCKICHTKFNPDLVNSDYVNDMVDKYHNVVETCKLIGLDLNNDVIKSYFSMTPYVERLPKLLSAVTSVFDKYNNTGSDVITDGVSPNPYMMFNGLVNPAIPIAPGYGYGYTDPNMRGGYGYGGYPNTMAGMQQNMVMGGNPFYAQGNGGYPNPNQPYGQPPMNPPEGNANGGAPQPPNGGVQITEQVKL